MRTAVLALSLALAVLSGAPALSLTYEGWPPPGGDCGAIADARGAAGTWYGEFAGRHYDSFREMYFPISARGCFVSEYECRRWTHEAMSFAGQGGVLYMRCRQGAPGY
jgi:hypothetical protein